jgi:hypothetical protein
VTTLDSDVSVPLSTATVKQISLIGITLFSLVSSSELSLERNVAAGNLRLVIHIHFEQFGTARLIQNAML